MPTIKVTFEGPVASGKTMLADLLIKAVTEDARFNWQIISHNDGHGEDRNKEFLTIIRHLEISEPG